ncbi:uncharacterized protein LOC123321490 [Coccinella septempunctata]|uniref:uncharacterized protein LOC123321490 n=1 Tax=Coccinella septempunctata TaxID=41139 RepID=UPI001D05C870|nr:uncharacterized protein LOC123321490 [Coccinella septempunctata]
MRILALCFILSTLIFNIEMQDDVIINTFNFPFGGPFMGLFVTLSIPLGLKNEDIFLGYNMEANYVLPENQTFLAYPPILGEGRVMRSSVYQLLSRKLSRFGYPGYECLLRLICDIAVHPVHISNGVLGDLIHILFTPSTSADEDFLEEYLEAERQGIESGNCSIYYKNCSESLLSLFTTVSDTKDIS